LQPPLDIVTEDGCAVSSLATPSLSGGTGRQHTGQGSTNSNGNTTLISPSQSAQSPGSGIRISSTAHRNGSNGGQDSNGGNDDQNEETDEEDDMETEHNPEQQPELSRTRMLFSVKYDGDTRRFKDQAMKDFGELFEAVQEVDDKITILPWRSQQEDNALPALTSTADIKAMGQIKREQYFNQLRCPLTEDRQGYKTIYANVNISHYKDSNMIVAELDEVLRNTKFSVTIPSLQVENTKEVGWFLRSHANLRRYQLEKAIYKDLGIKCELRWKAVNPLKSRDEKWTDDDKQTKAVHIFIEDGPQLQQDIETLEEAYSTEATTWPMKIRLRFVPIIPRSCTTSEQ
jgi:hypothetical protein